MFDIKYEITKSLGILSENAKGWSKELNLVSWNDHEPKYDIRDWSEGHEKMGKGVTLSGAAIKKLRDILNGMDDLELTRLFRLHICVITAATKYSA